jgi:hypothetical protein
MSGALDTIDLLLATSPTAPGGEIAMRQAELRKARATILRLQVALDGFQNAIHADNPAGLPAQPSEADAEATAALDEFAGQGT